MAKMTGKEALADLLHFEGVEYVFGIPGATEIHFMEALKRHPDIKYILGLNEIVCAGMAEGYARASGKPGFLNLHTGPGVAAALPMLYNAHRGGVPLVITAGQQHTRLLQYDPHLSGDLVGLGKHYSKWSTELSYADDIPAVIQRAFKMAMQTPTGPVFVSIPQDVLTQTLDFEYVPNTTLHTGLRPDREAVAQAARILLKAERPAIFVQDGVAKNEALKEVVTFAELIGARVYQPWMSDVNFPVNHPQYLGDIDSASPQGREILRQVDVLVGVGCPLFSHGLYSPEFPLDRRAKVIQIDDDPWEIGKNIPAASGIQGDIRASLIELIDTLQNSMSAEDKEKARMRAAGIAAERAKMDESFMEQVAMERDNVPISVTRLMQELKSVTTHNTIIVDDCWSSSGTLRRSLGLSESKSFFRARGGGSIGWGLSGALGVKLGAPGRPVIAVSGDGSAAWNMQSFWTAGHYNIPVTFIITSNRTYRQVKLMRKLMLGKGRLDEKQAGMELDQPSIDFCQLAQSMGVSGERCERPEDLGPILRSAMKPEQPRVIEVFIENNP
jgi:benzoylformate decarboxylase